MTGYRVVTGEGRLGSGEVYNLAKSALDSSHSVMDHPEIFLEKKMLHGSMCVYGKEKAAGAERMPTHQGAPNCNLCGTGKVT